MSRVLTASMTVPCVEPTRVNHTVTTIRHKVRNRMSILTEKSVFNSVGLTSEFRDGNSGWYFKNAIEIPTMNPIHCALSVPQAATHSFLRVGYWGLKCQSPDGRYLS